MPPKDPTKVDPKKSIRSHKTWVTDAIGRAGEFLGEHPDGLATSEDVKDAEELVEEIREKLSNMEKKWTDVLSPQLEANDPDGLFDDLDSDVHDTSEVAKKSINGLKRAVKIFKAKETAAPAAAAPVAPKKELKLNTAFKPSTLARSSNLEEFHAWEDSFRGYYELNTAFTNFHQLQSSYSHKVPQRSTAFHSDPQRSTAFHKVPQGSRW